MEVANPDVIVLDDAFQHRALKRDIDLLLVSRERGFGNGRMLPAGPMREPLRAIRRARAAIVISSGIAGQPSALTARQTKALSRIPVLSATLRPRALVRGGKGEWTEVPLGMAGRRAVAVSGLADPQGFYAMLHELEANLVSVFEYPDHHNYTAADWHAIVKEARDADVVLTTEKDLVKLEKFPFARDSLYALRLEVAMSPEDLATLDSIMIGDSAELITNADATEVFNGAEPGTARYSRVSEMQKRSPSQ